MTCYDGSDLIYAARNGDAYTCLAQNQRCHSEEDGFCGYMMGLERFLKNLKQESRKADELKYTDIAFWEKGGKIDVTTFLGPIDDMYFSLDRLILKPEDFLRIAMELAAHEVVKLDTEALRYTIESTRYHHGDPIYILERGLLEGKINEVFHLDFTPESTLSSDEKEIERFMRNNIN